MKVQKYCFSKNDTFQNVLCNISALYVLLNVLTKKFKYFYSVFGKNGFEPLNITRGVYCKKITKCYFTNYVTGISIENRESL